MAPFESANCWPSWVVTTRERSLSTLFPTMHLMMSGDVEKVSSSVNHVGRDSKDARDVTSYTDDNREGMRDGVSKYV